MELNITESLEKSILEPIYTHQNTLESEAFKKVDEKGLDTGKFYPGFNKDKVHHGTNIPFWNEVETKAMAKSVDLTKDFFIEHVPKFIKNLPEDALYGIFKGIENGVDATRSAFPGLEGFINEAAEANIAPAPFKVSLRDISKRVHEADNNRDKTFANNLSTYMFQAAPYLFLARSRLLQGRVGVKQAHLLAWFFASGMGFKNSELLASDIYAKALGDSKFMDSLKKFDEKISGTGVSVEGLADFTVRGADGLLFEKLFSGIKEVYRHFKISQMSRAEKATTLRSEKDIKSLSEGMVKQQDEKMLGFIKKTNPDQDDIKTATDVVKLQNNKYISEGDVQALMKDKNVKKVLDQQGKVKSTAGEFRDPIFQQNRQFDFNGQKIIGYDNAVAHYYGTGAANKDRVVHIMIGAPATGKSTKGAAIAEHMGAKVIDSDHFKTALGKKAKGSTSAFHEEGKYLAEKTLQTATANGDNIVYPIIGHNEDKVLQAIKTFQDSNYFVKLVYAKAPTNLARVKNIQRGLVTGRLIPDKYFSKDLDKKINFVYDVAAKEADVATKIKTGTVRKSAIIEDKGSRY